MASRKTYFGIGWPKASADPGSAPEDATEQSADPVPAPTSDHSAPTVVDDERVAEGLEQLRSWYQSDAPEGPGSNVTSSPAPPQSAQPQTRPTAVGHATGQPPMPARPIAPDPMRATMFGHDIHRFDFDAVAAAAEPPPAANPAPAAVGRTAGGGASTADAPGRGPETPPPASAWGPSSAPDPFRLADYLRRQAAQPHPPAAGWVSSLDETDARAAPRTPIVIFVLGFAALTAAILLGLQSRDSPGTGVGPALPSALPVPPSPAIDRSPTRPTTPAASGWDRTRDVAPERADVKPIVPRVAPMVLPRTKPRPQPVKAVMQPREQEGDGSPATELRPLDESATGGPADGTRARAPAQPIETARPAKPTDKKPRDKNAAILDTDSTLPPSLGE